MKKWFIILATGATLVLLLVGGWHWLKDRRFNSDAPTASFPAPRNMAEARRQDVAHLELFFEHERSWTPRTLQAARKAYAELSARAESMSDAEFDLAVARLVATADNAHTKVREYSRTERYSRLPFRGHWFADGYVIVRAYQGFEYLLSHEIVAIDGMSFHEVAQRFRPTIAGPEGTFRKYLPYLVESPELLHAAGVTSSPERVELTLVNRDDTLGSVPITITLEPPYPPPGDQIARSHYLLTSRVYSKLQPEWSGLSFSAEQVPMYLDFPDQQMQFRELPNLDAYFLQFWTNSDVGDTSIKKFCRAAERQQARNSRRWVIVDLRFNSGGNFNLTQDCLTDLARHIPQDGYVYVIIGGATFSAGIYSAAFLKQAAAGRAVLVGEPVGDHLVSWAEDNLLALPNSQIEIKFSTGMHDLTTPCADWRRCHWSAMNLDLAVDNLDPDLPAPLTFEDYANGVDPALRAIESHMSTH